MLQKEADNIDKFSKQIIALLCAFIFAQLITIIALTRDGHFNYALETVISTVIFFIISVLIVRYRLPYGGYLSILLILTIVSDDFLGRYLGLYNTSAIFDRIQHVFGIYSLALFSFILLNRIFGIYTAPKLYQLIFIISLGVVLGVAIEIIEFLMDTIFQPPMRNQPSLADTDLDLASDVAGAALAALHWLVVLTQLSNPVRFSRRKGSPE